MGTNIPSNGLVPEKESPMGLGEKTQKTKKQILNLHLAGKA